MKNPNPSLSESPLSERAKMIAQNPRVEIETIPYMGSVIDYDRGKWAKMKNAQMTTEGDRPSEIEAFGIGAVKPQVSAASARKGASARTAKQYGLMPGKTVATNGRIARNSTLTDGFNPSVWEVLRRLELTPVNKQSVELLEEHFGTEKFDFEAEKAIAVSRLFSAIEINSTTPVSLYNPSLQVCPRLLAAVLIVHKGYGQTITSEVRAIASLLSFRGDIPSVVKIGIDDCMVNHTAQLKPPVLLQKARIVGVSPTSSKFNRVSWVEPTNDNRIEPLEAEGKAFTGNHAIIQLSPLRNKGKAIASVRLIDRHNGDRIDLGTIRNLRGKLYFHSPLLLAGDEMREQMERAIKAYSGSKEQAAKRSKTIKAEIAELQKSIDLLRSQQRQFNTDQAEGIASLQRAIALCRGKLSEMSAPLPNVKTDLAKIPPHLQPDMLIMFKSVGMYPNQHLKSISAKSPLADPGFWRDLFFVEVLKHENFGKPLEFVRDLRK